MKVEENLFLKKQKVLTRGKIKIGIFATFAAFLNEGDEVICMEPFFDQYIVS